MLLLRSFCLGESIGRGEGVIDLLRDGSSESSSINSLLRLIQSGSGVPV
jgi:hypothetical protein